MDHRDRRQFLAAGGAAGAALLAGCSGACRQGIPFLGTGMPHDGEVATDPVASVPDGATVIEFLELPERERSLLQKAVEDSAAHVCMDGDGERARALRSFADRVTVDSSYLAYEGGHYALWVRVTDVVYAGTASAPEDDATPCC